MTYGVRHRFILGLSVCLTASLAGFGCGEAKKAEQPQDGNHTIVAHDDRARERKPAEIPEERNHVLKSDGTGETTKSGKSQKPPEETMPKQNLMQELKTPQGLLVRLSAEHDPWADAVVSFEHGKSTPKKNKNPWGAVGKPAGHSFALGHGGTLVLEFIDNVLVDGPGADLVIFEVGNAVEPTLVAISETGKDWIKIGRAGGSKSTIDIGPFVKPGQRFRFVRLKDAEAGKSKGSPFPGADINGVGALNSQPVLGAPSRKEIESRWKR